MTSWDTTRSGKHVGHPLRNAIHFAIFSETTWQGAHCMRKRFCASPYGRARENLAARYLASYFRLRRDLRPSSESSDLSVQHQRRTLVRVAADRDQIKIYAPGCFFNPAGFQTVDDLTSNIMLSDMRRAIAGRGHALPGKGRRVMRPAHNSVLPAFDFVHRKNRGPQHQTAALPTQ